MSGLTRKTVTVLFSDLVDSTPLGESLDPEALRALLSRYFAAMRDVIERHGGTVEKYIGDAIMAVFGIPQAHEDDALRAVRAAVEMRLVLGELNAQLLRPLAARTGVTTGEVVTGEGPTLVTGDTVNTAARLEHAASAGEILIGDPTYRLVRDAVDAAPLEPLALKGKAAPVDAWLVADVRPDVPGRVRRLDSALVDRRPELAALHRAFADAVETRSPRLVTILGTAGVGKSRLANELSEAVRGEATIVVGRCLPYGDGVTYWPLRDVVHGLGDVSAIVGPAAGDVIAGAIGASERVAPTEETFAALRMLVERVAATRPLVLGFDDIHWGQPTFLDLVEHLVDSIGRAPVLIVCVARPDLLEERPSWGRGTMLRLEPLAAEDASQLVDNLAGAALEPAFRRRLMVAAEGNPLFLEELVRMAEDDPGATAVPPTVHALLTARLDRLDRDEREVVGAASVVGRFFSQRAVAMLVGGDVDPELDALVRKDFLRREAVSFTTGSAFGFRHILIRDAAYEALPKAERASMHERLADWLDAEAGERPLEVEELVGWHLEQAAVFREELGAPDEELAARAGSKLAAAGRRAAARGDMSAAASLLTRATVLWRDRERPRVEIAPLLATSLRAIGELRRAEGVLDAALATAAAGDDPRLRAHAALARASLGASLSQPDWMQRAGEAADTAIPVFAAAGDDAGLAQAHHLLHEIDVAQNRFAAALARLERALEHARRAGDRRMMSRVSTAIASALYFGPTPVPEGIARCRAILADEPGAAGGAVVGCILGGLLAMDGRIDESRDEFASAVATLEELSIRAWVAYAQLYQGMAELAAGETTEADRLLSLAVRALEVAGDSVQLAFAASFLARAKCSLGDVDEARRLAGTARGGAPAGSLAEVSWRAAAAAVALEANRAGAAERLAREAVAIAAGGDAVTLHAYALADLAAALAARGRKPEALGAARAALALHEQKGDVVSARRVRDRLASLTGGAVHD